MLHWTSPSDPAVTTLQLRASVGPNYDAEDENLLADFPVSGTHTWSGTFGPNTPGTATAFKIFAITAEGNEKGSNLITVTHPVA